VIGAALKYVTDLRWRVFPVGGDGRTPMIPRGCHGASSEPGVVVGWWRTHPSANIALACGPGSGVLGLDIDRKGQVDGLARLAELEAEFGALPETVRSATPSGGVHLLFAYPAGPDPANRVGLKRYAADGERTVYHGLDVRAAGASLCLPPSLRPDGRYRWALSPDDAPPAPIPDWLLSLMRSEPPPRPPAPPLRLSTVDRTARYVCAAVDGECRLLAGMTPSSGRNQRLFVAAAKLGGLIGAGVLGQDAAESALEQAATECGLVTEDGMGAVRATIRSGIRTGVSNPRDLVA
jgi:hypothetical protein